MPQTRPPAKLFIFIYLIITCLCFIFYSNSLNNPFIWDDEALIVRNPLIKDYRFWGKAFTSDFFFGTTSGSNFYRPLQTLSFIWDYYFWQLDPRGYHITNIFLHSIVAFLVAIFAYILCKDISISFACGLLFAINPLHTEAVTYTSGRSDLLLGIFLLSSFILFVRGSLCLSLLAFICGLLSKELALVFPFCILAYVFYFRRNTQKKTYAEIFAIASFFAIAGVYLISRISFLKFLTFRPPALTKFPLLLRIAVLPRVVFSYLKLLILPINLHMSREMVRPVSFLGFFIAYFLFGMMVVGCIYALKYKERRKITSFLLSWFLIFLLPQSGIFPINAFLAEHFIYLSSISFFLALAWLLRKYLRKQLFIFSLICLLVFYGLLTYSRNFEWSYPIIFFKGIIKNSAASFQAHNNLGLEYERRGDFQQAIEHYEQALKIYPELLEAHSNLANLYFKMARFKEAEREYLIVEKTAPGEKAGEVQNNIAALYEMQGLYDSAVDRYKRALSLDPKLKFSHFNLARLYFMRGNVDLASREILESLELKDKPQDESSAATKKIISEFLVQAKNIIYASTFYNDLGIKFAQVNLIEEAIISFETSLELAPGNADTHFNLGLAYLKKGLKRKAVLEFKSALKINPGHPKAKRLLSELKRSPQL